ncbi:MAG: hypothetical protein LBR49_01690 [Tannerella sp.]|nr:hypothetical protein [Tannerella sp.]
MKHSRWMAAGHEGLHDQGKLTVEYLNNARVTQFGLSGYSSWIANTFQPAWTGFDTAFAAWLNPATRTQLIITTLTNAERTFAEAYMQMYNILRSSPLITDTDMEAMGLPKHPSGDRTPTPVPTTYPDYTVDTSVIRQLAVHFRDHNSESRAKPEGVHGVEIKWGFGGALLPADGEELPNSVFDTHSPYTITFAGSERGRTVYFCLRWENTRGEKGPWSEVVSAVVP